MQAGFALVEIGLNSAKNAVNILFKNTIDFCIGVLLFYVCGYAMMYPGADFAGKYFGYAQPNFAADVTADDMKAGFSNAAGTLRKLHPQADFLFQAAFCATTATIVSGAVAGRLKVFWLPHLHRHHHRSPVSNRRVLEMGRRLLATAGFHDLQVQLSHHGRRRSGWCMDARPENWTL